MNRLIKYLPKYHFIYSIIEAANLKFTYLYVQGERSEGHRANKCNSCGHRIHNLVVFIQPQTFKLIRSQKRKVEPDILNLVILLLLEIIIYCQDCKLKCLFRLYSTFGFVKYLVKYNNSEYLITFERTFNVLNSFRLRISASGNQNSLIKLTSTGIQPSDSSPTKCILDIYATT